MKAKISIVVLAIVLLGLVDTGMSADIRIEGRTVVDEAGRRISAEKPFKRIISLYGAHTENLFALGLDKEIIGVSRSDTYPEAAACKPKFSFHEDPEKFLAARPDLVLIRPMLDRGYSRFVQRLESSGITVASFQPNTVDEMFVYWKALGVLTGRLPAAENMVRQFKERIAGFEAVARNISPKKKVYFEAIHGKMKTFAPGAIPLFALETAGGVNVAKDARSVRGTNIAAYGKERILSRAKEIEVYLAQKGAMNQPTINSIKNEPGFQIIEAVKNDRIYLIDETIVSRPTIRLLEGIEEIAKILYPNR